LEARTEENAVSRSSIRSVLASALAIGISACATSTPYQPAHHGLGYSEQRLETNRYKIMFAGNAETPRRVVETYLLYRAAEVTLQNGYDYFVLTDQSTDKETSYTQTFSGGFGSYAWYPYSYWQPSAAVSGAESMPRSEYQAQASILVFKGSKPAADPEAFDARDLKANLEPTIVRPK
jgi:hypothetical protein